MSKGATIFVAAFLRSKLSFSATQQGLPSCLAFALIFEWNTSEVAEIFTGTPGAFVDLETTINDFEEVWIYVLWMLWTFKFVSTLNFEHDVFVYY